MTNNHPILFVTSGGHNAKWYSVEKSSAVLKKEYHMEKTTLSDKEGAVHRGGKSSSQGGSSDISNSIKEQELHAHCVNLATETAQLFGSDNFAHLVVAAPEYLKNYILEALEKKLPDVTPKFMPGDFHNAELLEIVAMGNKSLQVV